MPFGPLLYVLGECRHQAVSVSSLGEQEAFSLFYLFDSAVNTCTGFNKCFFQAANMGRN